MTVPVCAFRLPWTLPRAALGSLGSLSPRLLLAGLVALALWAGPARAEVPGKPKPPPKPPGYEMLRFREDYAAMRATCATGAAPRCDWGDRLKALALGPCAWLDVGGQVRLRFERFENQGLAPAPTADDDWLLTRVRLHANLEWGPHVRLFAEGIFADQEERALGPRPIDENHGDLLNLFGEVRTTLGPTKWGLRGGRQELLFGKQRLIGPLDWGNTRRTFEGVVGYAQRAGWRFDAFFVQPVTVDVDKFDESAEVDFAGGYYVNTCRKGTVWEVYGLYYNNEGKTWLGVTGEDERFTLGGAWRGPLPGTPFQADLEAAVQAGTFVRSDIGAWMATGELSWTPCGACWKPRLALGADYASGDADGPGGDAGTFHHMFPTGHLWFGWVDLVGRQNLVAGRVTFSVQPTEKLTVRSDVHGFWRAETADAVYTAAGTELRPPGATSERYVGTEFDLVATLEAQRHLDLEAGLGHFLSGDFLSATGASEDVTFFWLGATFTF